MSIILSDVSYHYYSQQSLFENINLSVAHGGKVSVVGNNGTGKSTLLKLIAGELAPSSGSISCSSGPYYVPQQSGITGITVSEALSVKEKIDALHAIYGGSTDAAHYETLNDDWDIEPRCRMALDHWGLTHIDPTDLIDTLSGGEKTKLLLSGIMIHNPDIILLDEPTNHLDLSSRRKLYDFIRVSRAAMIIVSHDVNLLNLLDETYELSPKELKPYGGNYDFYLEQKETEDAALEQQIKAERTALRLARKKAQEIKERQEKRFSQGERNKDQLPRIMRKTVKDRGEATGARLKDKHADIIDHSTGKLEELRGQQRADCRLKIDFKDAELHNGKLLISANNVNFAYKQENLLWKEPLSLEIRSGERLHLTGDNGTGKTTLIKLFTGKLLPTEGEIEIRDFSFTYLDQEYGMVNTPKSVLELAQDHNVNNLPDHEIKLRLHRALFPKEMWDKTCATLSGGEKMRLCLCCLMISNHVPDMFILDEPTNNLDLSSLSILTDTIKSYRGTVLVISHDMNFINEIGITRNIGLM